MRALEPRVLLDAAGVETALDHVNDAVHSGLADDWFARREGLEPQSAIEPATLEIVRDDADTAFVTDEPDGTGLEYVFVAADVADIDALTAVMPGRARVVVLDADSDGVEQMAEVLAEVTDLRAVHVVSHGRAGALSLGTAELTAASIDGRHAIALARIGAALDAEGDLLFYGCDFGAGPEGAHALDRLARATGADVAASTDDTGGTQAGGDWVLEAERGTIEAEAIDAGDALGAGAILESDHFIEVDGNSGASVPVNAGGRIVQTFTAEDDDDDAPVTGYRLDHIHLRLSATVSGSQEAALIAIVDPTTGRTVATGVIQGSGLSSGQTKDVDVDFVIADDAPNGGLLRRGDTYEIEISALADIWLETADGDEYDGGALVGTGTDIGMRIAADRHFGPLPGTPPEIVSPAPGETAFTIDENSQFVVDLAATDPEGPVTFTLEGRDADLFEIVGDELRLIDASDYERDARGPFLVRLVASQGGERTERDLNVTIGDVDEAPTTAPTGTATPQGEPVDIRLADFGIVDQDTADTLAWIRVTGENLNGGRLTYTDAGGTEVDVAPGHDITPAELASLRFVPDADDDGMPPPHFTYRVATARGGGTPVEMNGPDALFTVRITPNTAPTADPTSIPAVEDIAIDISPAVLGLSDAESHEIAEFLLVSLPATSGRLLDSDGQAIEAGLWMDAAVIDGATFDLALHRNGEITFEYRVRDELGAESETLVATFEVASVDDAPVALAPVAPLEATEDEAILLPTSFFRGDDVDGQPITRELLEPLPEEIGTFTEIDGRTWFVPAPNVNGRVTFEYRVENSLVSDNVATGIIDIAAVNDAPVATPQSDLRSIDATFVTLEMRTAFDDADGDALTYEAEGLPPGLAIDRASGTISGTIERDASGESPYRVEITADDGFGGTASVELLWFVANPSPTASNGEFVVLEDGSVAGELANFVSDPDGDPLVFAQDGPPTGGSVIVRPDGGFLFTPDPGATGEMSFGYGVDDGEGGIGFGAILVTVLPNALSFDTVPDETLVLGSSILEAVGDANPIAIRLVGALPENGALLLRDRATGEEVAVAADERIEVERLGDLLFRPAGGNDRPVEAAFSYALEMPGEPPLGRPVAVTIAVAAVAADPSPAPTPPPVAPTAPVDPETIDPDEEDEPEAEEDEEDMEDEIAVSGDGGTSRPNLPAAPSPTAARPLAPAAPVTTVEVERLEPEPSVPASPVAPTEPEPESLEVPRPDTASGIAGYTFTPMAPLVLKREVARAGDDVREHESTLFVTATTVSFAFGSALAVGSVSYLLQGGAIAGALLSALPAWRRYDPIEIVAGRKDENGDEEPTAVERMRQAVDAARARVEAPAARPSHTEDTS